MLEGQRRDVLAILVATANAGETYDRADVGTAVCQRGDFTRDVEIGLLDADGRLRGHAIDLAAGHRVQIGYWMRSGNHGVLLDVGVMAPAQGDGRALVSVGHDNVTTSRP